MFVHLVSNHWQILCSINFLNTVFIRSNAEAYHMIFRNLRFQILIAVAVFSCGQAFCDGLPGEYLLSNRWRQVFLFRSPVDNPAFLMEEQYSTVRAVNYFPFNSGSLLMEAGVVYPFDLYNTAGISIIAERGGEVRGYSFEGDSLTDGRSSRNNNIILTGSYASNPWGRLSIGANLNLAYQGNFGEPKFGCGGDLGLSFRVLLDPLLGYHVLGLTYKNLLSPGVSRYQAMPFSSQISTQYHAGLFGNRVTLDYQISLSDFMARPSIFADRKELEWDMELQLGFSPVSYFNVKGFTDVNQWSRFGSVGFALGADLSYLNRGKDLSLYYQFRKNLNSELLGSQSVYVIAQFGTHREELYARKMANLARISPSNLYNQAMLAYHNENYWDAYILFSRLYAQYPDFFKNDAVAYYSASSLENLDMRKSALQSYADLKSRFSKSSFVYDADLGMMRILYRDGMYHDVERQFRVIRDSDAPEGIKQYAAYYMGETEVIRMEYLRALVYFAMINSGHEAYVFAQHSSATVQEASEGQRTMIIDHLRNAIDAVNVKTPAQREIVNRSLVLLGYIYYEDNSLSKAVTALRMVPENSYYYEDAQLGLAWLAVKAQQWKDCISTGRKLVSLSKKRVIQCEGKLIQAYGFIQQQKYDIAEKLLLEAAAELDAYELASSGYLDKEKVRYDSTRNAYDSLASTIVVSARNRIPQKTLIELHKRQSELKEGIDTYLQFSDEQKRERFFERGIFILKEDLEFAIATVQRIRAGTGDQKNETEKSINDQIEKLKGQIQEIEE